MSSVVISGDTSGSITLQAPAVAGSTTLTLPATTATLATLTTPSFASTIGVGGATASASGSGISFPATQSASSDANTLDDYEEGTWTPTFDTSGGNTFTQSGTGIYTKIGRNVTASGFVSWTAKSGGAGVAISLPFATISTSSWRGGVTYGTITYMTFVSATKIITASLDPSSSYFSLRYANNGANWSALTPSDMGTSGEFQFTAVYPI